MSDAIRWPVIILCAIVLIGLIAYARGPDREGLQ